MPDWAAASTILDLARGSGEPMAAPSATSPVAGSVVYHYVGEDGKPAGSLSLDALTERITNKVSND